VKLDRTYRSPNYNARAAGKDIDCVILHYTNLPDAVTALAMLIDDRADRPVSAHYLIDLDGRILQLVDDEHRAWHAGVSYWQGETDMNSRSIGIELVNRGHQGGYHAFPAAQLEALKHLLGELKTRHAIPAARFLAHSDIAPERKEDPGELFPWQDFAQLGFGLWPETCPEVEKILEMDVIRGLLRRIGYACAATGGYDPALRRVLLAFQRHWAPDTLSGLTDALTASRLQAVAAMMPHWEQPQ
jgi:N-acetylmuramoyl-L-alanine amidase